jgi:hypothetical protein
MISELTIVTESTSFTTNDSTNLGNEVVIERSRRQDRSREASSEAEIARHCDEIRLVSYSKK